MIQILTYSGSEPELKGKDVVLNKLHDAQSLDEFDINIISLQNELIWRNRSNGNGTINIINDLKSLAAMLQNSKTAKNIILYPQNYRFYSDTRYENKSYWEERELKNMIGTLSKRLLGELFTPLGNIDIVYENTTTKVEEKMIASAFCYANVKDEILTKSKSGKATTIRRNNVVLTTLKLDDFKKIEAFLKDIKILKTEQELPQWIKEVKMFDDDKQFGIIEENNKIIQRANDNISEAIKVINRNNEFKSILYTSGDELVNVVFEILQEMLGCDLSEFKDKKKEDFNFKIRDRIFVGEIKGVTPNVKKANVSQLDVHVQDYSDEKGVSVDDIAALLIINHQRNKPLAEREPVHVDTVKLAERNGSLIVETITLLKLFEKYLSEEVTREECLEALINNTGLLTI